MYRAEDTRGESMDIDGIDDGVWIRLEPELLSNVAQRLCKKDAGAMRLACKTWQQSISSGVHSMAVTRKMFKGQLCDLPNRFPGLVHLDLSNYAWLTDSEMIGLQDLPRLQDLEVIFGHELSDEGIFHLAFMKSIRRLKLVNFVRLHDSNIDLLAELPNLEELTIQGAPRITDEGISCISGLTGLHKLTINFAQGITDAGLESMSGLLQLQELSLVGCKSITGSGLSSLQGLAELTKLSLERTQVNDKGLETLLQLTSLRRLSLAHCHNITDATLAMLNELPLEWLDLTKCSKITGPGMRSLSKMDGVATGNGIKPDKYMQCLFDDIQKGEDVKLAASGSL